MELPRAGTYAKYLRKSRADIEKEKYGEETLAKHDRVLTALCESEGYVVKDEDVFREIVSGESIAERREFQRLMDGVVARRYAGIVVHAVDRLGRGDIMEYGWILSTLQWTQTLVITPGKVYDPNDEADMQSLQLQMLIGNGELKASKARLAAGRAQAASEGEYIMPIPPYGYDRAVIDRKHTLVPNDRASVVLHMFESIAAGFGPASLANELNRRGVRTLTGRLWTPAGVRRAIQNPVYKGYVRWRTHKTKIVSRNGLVYDKRRMPNYGESDYIESKGIHEPIVPVELWERANAALRPSPRVKQEAKISNPLAGLMFCAECGKSIGRHVTRYNGQERARYLPSRYSGCNAKSASEEAVMSTLVGSLESVASDLAYLVENGDAEAERAAAERERIEMDMKAARRKADKLVDLYTEELIGMDEFRDRRAPVDEQTARLQERLKELDSTSPPDRSAQLVRVRDAIDLLKDKDVDAELKNRLLKQVIERIEYVNDGEKRRRTKNLRLDVYLR